MNLRCGVVRRVGGACSAHVALWPGDGTPFDACRTHLPAEVGEVVRQQRRTARDYDGTPPPAELADHLRALGPVACSCGPGCLIGGRGIREAARKPPAAEEGAARPVPSEAAGDQPVSLLCGQREHGSKADACAVHCARWPGPDHSPLNACLEHLDEAVRARVLAERDKAVRDRQPLPEDLRPLARAQGPVVCEQCGGRGHPATPGRVPQPTTRPKPKPRPRDWNSIR